MKTEEEETDKIVRPTLALPVPFAFQQLTLL